MRSRGLSTDGKYERMQKRISEGLGGKTPVTCRLDGAVVSTMCSTHQVQAFSWWFTYIDSFHLNNSPRK